MTTLPGIIEDLLIRGSADWVDACELAWVVKSTGGLENVADIRDTSVRAITETLHHGLMTIGDVTDTGFVQWDLSIDDSIARVNREWRQLGRLPDLGEICWLENTDEGDRRAEVLFASR